MHHTITSITSRTFMRVAMLTGYWAIFLKAGDGCGGRRTWRRFYLEAVRSPIRFR
jgi:hypothetical protein